MSKRRHDSENEDDPEPFQSSGDEWDLEQAKKEETGRRTSSRISRKPKRPIQEESESDEEDEASDDQNSSSDEEASKKRNTKKKPARSSPKKSKVTNDSDLSNDTNSNMSKEDNGIKKDKEAASTDSDSSRNAVNQSHSRGIHRKFIPKTIFSEDYATGSFVILKKDAQGGDPSKHPCIWRIDGKALLQKYEAFDEEEKVRHKNTSIYTGWSPLDKDLYAPITVDVVRHNNNNLTVEVQWDKLKVINADSD